MALRIKRLHIGKKTDCIVFEHDDNWPGDFVGLRAGMRVFCGHCGQSMGEASKDLQFPFAHEQFFESLSYRNCDVMYNSFICHICGDRMFKPYVYNTPFGAVHIKPTWEFQPVALFVELQKPFLQQLKSVLNIQFTSDEADQMND